MKISEIARAAGCSVRAVRHYHEVGVLAEPPRNSSGYRDYSLEDLAELFRIRAFVQAGVPLADISNDPAVLDRAHALLGETIRELQLQQRKLDALRRGRNGVPLEIAEKFDELARNHPDVATALSRELAVLSLLALGGLATDATWEKIVGNLKSTDIVTATIQGLRLWQELESPAAEHDLIDRIVALSPRGYMLGVMDTLKPGDMPVTISDVVMTPAQAEAFRRLT